MATTYLFPSTDSPSHFPTNVAHTIKPPNPNDGQTLADSPEESLAKMESCSVSQVSPSLFLSNVRFYHRKKNAHLSPAARASQSQSQPPRGKLRVVDKSWPKRRMLCAKGASVSLPEKQPGDEIITEEELMGLGTLGDKCKEVRGIAELLECLESEAIMGEDEGKEPIDYNRRARIFDKSSRVFQALKQNATNPS